MKRIPLVLFILLGILQNVAAKIVVYTANDGLCNNYVTSIVKDTRGIMWIGTKNGLSRYDGYTFTEQPGLQNIGINNLVYDKKRNAIWVGTKEDGLYKIDGNTFIVTHIKVDGINDKAPIHSVFLQHNGDLYFTFKESAVFKIDSTNRIHTLNIFENPYLIALIKGNGSHPLFIYSYKKQKSLIELQSNLQQQTLLSKIDRHTIINKYKDLAIYSTQDGVIHFWDITRKQFVDYSLPAQSTPLTYMDIQDDNLFAIHKGQDPIKISLTNKKISKISFENNDVLRFHTSLNCVFEDEQGNTWIGSDRGIFKIIKSKNSFETILSSGPPSLSIRAIIKDEKNDMYVGTYEGLYYKSAQSKSWLNYKEVIKLQDNKDIIAPYCLLNDTGSFLYFGSWEIPLGKFNKKTKTYETIIAYSTLAPFQIVYSLLRDNNGKIWAGTNAGLFAYDPLTKTAKAFPDSSQELKSSTVKMLKKRNGHDNEIWIGTNNGLYLLNTTKGIILRLNSTSNPALSDNEVLSIEEDIQNNVWIGTNGGGINILQSSFNSIHYLRKADGLSDNVIYSMLWQDNNRLWVGTSHGLSCYDKTQNAFVNYYMRDGLSDNDFDHNSYFKDVNGRMYFGGINGINAFYPDSLRKMNLPFSVFLSSFSKWDNNDQTFISTHHLTGNSEKITMNPYDHSLTFNFALTDYTNPDNNTYFFRINDLYSDWVSLNHQNMLRLDGLSNGKHFIEIKALNASGIPAINTLKFEIVIIQPFYKTSWFYAIIIFCIAALGYTLFYIKFDNLKKLQALRIQIASTLHDEMGSLLTRIATFADSVRFSFNSESEKNEKLDRISELSRSANATMNDTLWSIDARNDYAISLIDRMREHAENMLLPNNIEVQFKFDPVSNEQKISPEIRQELILIYKEAINNLAKHGKGNYAKISFHKTGKSYTLTIENDCDNPNEINFSGSGQGIRNILMRAKRIEAKAEISKHNNIFVLEISKIASA
jgi:ligand-binding sensor domain-containing protein/two-component sensor histidine kinase